MENQQRYFFNDSIVSENRDHKPVVGEKSKICPFCLEHFDELEKVNLQVQGADFLIRSVHNKYPVAGENSKEYGFHDVIIDTANHNERARDFSNQHWQALLKLMQTRWHQFMQNPRIRFIQIFKNDGVDAGASIYHSHWQMVALEKIPYGVYKQYELYDEAVAFKHTCILCHLEDFISLEETDFWHLVIPSRPEWAYEVWLVPKKHRTHYGQLQDAELEDCSKLLKKMLQVYERVEPGCSFNICMMSGPVKESSSYHFHIKLMMRRSNIAGFELATRCHILTISPEHYGRTLKRALETKI